MKKPKIAICFTGEVRDYNNNISISNHNFKKAFEDWADIDFFGHTWTEQPQIDDSDKFIEVKTTSQDILWNHIKSKDPFSPMIITDKIRDSKKFQDMFVNGTDYGIRNWMKEIITGTYAQLNSSWECFNIVPQGEYDAIIKFRWDIQIQDTSQTFQQELLNFINSSLEPSVLAISYEEEPPGSIFIDDLVFVFNQAGHNKLIEHLNIERQIYDMGKARLLGNSSHGLWEDYFKYHGLEIKTLSDANAVQVLFNKEYKGPDEAYKPNKKWGI